MRTLHSAVLGSSLLVLAATSCLAAATTSKVRVDKAEGELPQCESFVWLAAPGDAVSLTEQRVKAEAMRQLAAKGYTELNDNAACKITFHFSASAEQKKSGPKIGIGVGGGSGGIGGGIGLGLPIGKKTQPGTFTLDVIDAARNAQVWSGTVDTKSAAAELSEAEAKEIVQKVLEKYPDFKAAK